MIRIQRFILQKKKSFNFSRFSHLKHNFQDSFKEWKMAGTCHFVAYCCHLACYIEESRHDLLICKLATACAMTLKGKLQMNGRHQKGKPFQGIWGISPTTFQVYSEKSS